MPTQLQAEFLTFWRFNGQCFVDGLTTLIGIFPGVEVTPLNVPQGVNDPIWRDPQGAHVKVKLPYELWQNMIQVQQWFDAFGDEKTLYPWALVDQRTFLLDPSGNPTGEPLRWDWAPEEAPVKTKEAVAGKVKAARDKFLRQREAEVKIEEAAKPVVEV